MRIILRIAAVAALVLAVLCGGAYLAARSPGIAPVAPPQATAFPAASVARGATLAAIGDCAVCHTAAGGAPFAGGRPVPTPFGTIVATNITPDPQTGIGRWSPDAFRRAMREGVSRDGHYLYPVLPYPHFTRATDEDIGALYAFLMTRAPVVQPRPANGLPFPLDQRILLAGWNLLFLRPGPWQPDPAHDAAWNRGEYLVEAIGHCGACHTPRNMLGAEEDRRTLGGGDAEGWYAPPLQAASPARVPWTAAALAAYLRTGFHAEHGAAAGPMTAVTDALGSVPETDVAAMATYLAAQMPRPAGTTVRPPSARLGGDPDSEMIFVGACGACHAPDAPMTRAGAPPLSLSSSVNANTPRGVIQVILNGIPPREGAAAPMMPAFRDLLTDDQITRLAGYLRIRFTDRIGWPNVADEVKRARHAGSSS